MVLALPGAERERFQDALDKLAKVRKLNPGKEISLNTYLPDLSRVYGNVYPDLGYFDTNPSRTVFDQVTDSYEEDHNYVDDLELAGRQGTIDVVEELLLERLAERKEELLLERLDK